MSLITEEALEWSRQPFEQRQFGVARHDIAKYAQSIGANDPVYSDVDVARAAGHPDILAPPYFPIVARMHTVHLFGRESLEPDGSPTEDVPPIHSKRAMAGETELELGAPVHAGDTLTIDKKIVEMYEKEGSSGPLVFVKMEFDFHNQHGHRVLRERYTRIYR